MNFNTVIILILFINTTSANNAMENSSHSHTSLEQILKSDDLPAFLKFTKGHEEATTTSVIMWH